VHDPYPVIEASWSGSLRVSPVHTLYVETSGSASGIPVVFVHGGPGTGTVSDQRRFFDPGAYRIVLFDQRGCGRSVPHSSVEDNDTWRLIEDMEKVREHLGIETWVVFGGSWGSTLSLAYAEAHPDRVSAMVLWGIDLIRTHELDWLYRRGANYLFPDLWEQFLAPIPPDEHDDLVRAYHRRVFGDDPAIRASAAEAWATWESSLTKLLPDPAYVAHIAEPRHADAVARLETHYFVNRGFFSNEEQLLDGVDLIRHIPATIVQGRYDMICPMTSAWDLQRRWPEASFEVVPDAGHSSKDRVMIDRLVAATDRLRSRVSAPNR
jgi:proline iminopeptidase